MLALLPAYGRSYETLEAMEQDWNDGKDFKILNGPYCSIRDMQRMKDMGHDIALVWAFESGTVYKLIHKVSVNGTLH